MCNNKNLDFITIPNYDLKVLPEGVHQITESEFQNIFVTPFSTSSTRVDIAEKYKIFRQKLQIFFSSIHWIDGSFVENKINPNDVDVAVILLNSDILNFGPNFSPIYLEYFKRKSEIKKKYHTDVYLIVEYSINHPFYNTYKDALRYWKTWFGHTRNVQPKGFVELRVKKL